MNAPSSVRPVGPTRIAIAGSTGSIGTQTLDVCAAQLAQDPGRVDVVAIGAQGAGPASIEVLVEQCRTWRPAVVAVADPAGRDALAARLAALPELAGRLPEVVADQVELVEPADVVVNGVVGFAGLGVTVAALGAGRRLALANKESLIAGAPVVQPLRGVPGAELVPVDSEHGAIHQCLRSSSDAAREVARLVLTASGGPFRGRSATDLAGVTVADALAHPTWSMGPKITVDSSTLMNKGLEVIEAHELFGTPYDAIEVVVHPQSVVHSMVEFTDGSTIAQLSMPDMRLPIGYALAWPHRLDVPYGRIDWSRLARLDFAPPDRETFRALDLAYAAGRAGGSAPAWLNAANEVAVAAFLDGRIDWLGIAAVCADALDAHVPRRLATVDDVVACDAEARRVTAALVAARSGAAVSSVSVSSVSVSSVSVSSAARATGAQA